MAGEKPGRKVYELSTLFFFKKKGPSGRVEEERSDLRDTDRRKGASPGAISCHCHNSWQLGLWTHFFLFVLCTFTTWFPSTTVGPRAASSLNCSPSLVGPLPVCQSSLLPPHLGKVRRGAGFLCCLRTNKPWLRIEQNYDMASNPESANRQPGFEVLPTFPRVIKTYLPSLNFVFSLDCTGDFNYYI